MNTFKRKGKEAVSLLLALLLLVFGTSCARTEARGEAKGAEETSRPAESAEEAAQAIIGSQPGGEAYLPIEGEDRDFWLSGLYDLSEVNWTEAAVYAAGGTDAREVAVICHPLPADAEAAAEGLEAYRLNRIGDFFGYVPAQAELAENGVVMTSGKWSALLLCEDMEAARSAFESAAGGRGTILSTPEPSALEVWEPDPTPSPTLSSAPEEEVTPEPTAAETPIPAETPAPTSTETPVPASAAPSEPAGTATPKPSTAPTPKPSAAPTPTPASSAGDPNLDISGFTPFHAPNEHNMSIYDTSDILKAWKSGDISSLEDRDRALYIKCKGILREVVKEGMTDVEKELALHDWLVQNCKYDESVYEPGTPDGQPGSLDPRGPILNGRGLCLGYATAFQLLMDLAGIDCITVIGAAYNSTEDHGWNMVRLDGEWYCVDVTWDDPTGNYDDWPAEERSLEQHRYFNVTSEKMRRTDHQWDYRSVPEATATRYRWDGAGPLPS